MLGKGVILLDVLSLKKLIMETDDVGKKKINNEQEINEGFSGEYVDENYNPKKSILKQEKEVDKDGKVKVVERARNVGKPKDEDEQKERNWDENESLSRSMGADEFVRRKVENTDRNSDIVAERENVDES